jgi:hypothetical protein
MSWTQVTPMNDGAPVGANNPLQVTQSGSGASGAATSDNQVTIIAQLEEIIAAVDKGVLTVRLDEVNDNLFYVGKAEVGTLDGDSAWQIARFTTTGVVLKGEYANGSTAFDQTWNDRLTINYI